MARKFKSFGSPVGAQSDEPIEFEIYGHTFRCVPALPGRRLLEFVAISSSEDYGASAEAVLEFLDGCVVADQREGFRALCESETEIVPMETIQDLSAWLVEQYSGTIGEDGAGKASLEQSSDPSDSGQPITPSLSVDEPLQPELTSTL